jgi:thioester reductase-like protein
MSLILVTGFPGFLGSRLLPRVLRRELAGDDDARAACLVQPRHAGLARRRMAEIVDADPALGGRIELVEGDITAPDLGLDELTRRRLATATQQVWHLAAVYDLAVRRDVGLRVNLDGTRHVLRFAEDCADLRRHHYVSTCYVSGRHAGIYRESDLDVGQRFNNFYEETKFLAEAEVARARDGGMPTTVYRPGIVVGDSRTGATQKFDGPYYLLQWLLRQPRWAVMPVIGDPTAIRFAMVPSDFVVDALDQLAGLPCSDGVTYALTDPRPPTVEELIDAMARATGRRVLRVRLPRRAIRAALSALPPLARLTGLPAEAIDYFVHPTHYDTSNASRDLAGSGIHCPPVEQYLPHLVEFFRAHRDADLGAMT